MVTVSDTTNFIRKHIVAIIIIWLFVLIVLKFISVRTTHQELFNWYNKQGDISKEYSCVSAWDISRAIELPGIFTVKPFQNKDTPYFLDSLARRYGDSSNMPPPQTIGMTIEDWCIGLGYRLHQWAASVTNNFDSPSPNNSAGWLASNLALSMDSGATVIDSYTVYQKYGSPLAWQYPQWKGWISCRIRPPAFPSWDNNIALVENQDNYSQQEPLNTNLPYGSFSWGSPFVQSGYLAPFGCSASSCSQDKDKSFCNSNTCGHVATVEGDKSCQPGGLCLIGQSGSQGAYDKHQLLPQEPSDPNFGDLYCTQFAPNNPFIAYNIPASSPIILRFLGYGFDTPDETQTNTGGTTIITYSGGPASDQYTQISQFLDLVDGGFFKYAENSGKPQSYLENYLFGEYTFEAKGTSMAKSPKAVSQPPCGKGKLVSNLLQGGLGGAGVGAMALASTAALGPAAPAIAIGAVGAGLLGGWAGTSSACGGGSDSCLIM